MEIIFFLIAVIAFVIFIVKKGKSDNKRYEEWRQKQEKEQESKKQIEKSHRDLPSNQAEQNIEQAQSQQELRNVVSPAAQAEKEIEKPKNITITFPVVGLDYEGRRQKLTRIINQYKRNDYFYPLYDGYTNKEIKEELFGDVYEISGDLDDISIEKEDDNPYDSNALKVIVGDFDEKKHHIGYVPKEHCVEIRKLMESHRLEISNSIYGGKYKTVEYDYDDDFNEKEKVVVESTPYGLEIDLIFIPK